jgi:ArsR family transcriptional regulator
MNTNLRQEINNLHSDLCSALADSNRIMILYLLAEQAYNVNDLAETIELSQPSTSRHLKTLRERGLVRSHRRGASVEYRLADHRVIEALDILRAVLHDQLSHRANLIEEEMSQND